MKIPKQKKTGIPLIGLGTWKLREDECKKAVELALELGYRHIDTADQYENHKPIGQAIRLVPREDIFLTSKIAVHDLKPSSIQGAVPRFLEELDTPYLDLLLIHWPDPNSSLSDALKAMMGFKEQGLVRSIGVSNFVRFHLESLAQYQFPLLTNQIELHPYLQRKQLIAACQKTGISITAYRPLAKGAFESDPHLGEIGAKRGKSASQIALRWLIQQDIAAIPKASTLQHLKDNLAIFDFSLSDDEMNQINSLDQGKRFCAPEGFPIYED